MKRNEIRKKLKKELDKGRYEHTIGVMYTAASLAMAYECSIDDAMTAGLLHDCAKCIPNEEKIGLCRKNHIVITDVEYENPYLLHAKLGAFLAKTEYGIKNPEILHAIRIHTTGEPNMSLLDKILYVADCIEPGRDKAPNLPCVRKLAFEDIDACVAQVLDDCLRYNHRRGITLDSTSQDAYEYYRKFQKK